MLGVAILVLGLMGFQRLGSDLFPDVSFPAIAVSPTDTMPLTRWAKALMAVESLIAYAVAILVVSRAVGILGAS